MIRLTNIMMIMKSEVHYNLDKHVNHIVLNFFKRLYAKT